MWLVVFPVVGERAVVGPVTKILPFATNHVMKKFSGPQGVIVVQTEIIHERARIFEYLIGIPFCKSIAARVVWVDA